MVFFGIKIQPFGLFFFLRKMCSQNRSDLLKPIVTSDEASVVKKLPMKIPSPAKLMMKIPSTETTKMKVSPLESINIDFKNTTQ